MDIADFINVSLIFTRWSQNWGDLQYWLHSFGVLRSCVCPFFGLAVTRNRIILFVHFSFANVEVSPLLSSTQKKLNLQHWRKYLNFYLLVTNYISDPKYFGNKYQYWLATRKYALCAFVSLHTRSVWEIICDAKLDLVTEKNCQTHTE